jgi:hypothetical protein
MQRAWPERPGAEHQERGEVSDEDGGAPAHHRRDGGRPRPTPRGRPDRRSLLTRLPFVLVAGGALAAALAIDDPGRDPQPSAAPDQPPALVVASAPGGRESSTWFCAAGTASEGGMADHTVTVLNLTARPREATLTVFAGGLMAPAPLGAPPSTPAATGAPLAPAAPAPVARQVTVPAGGHREVRLGDVVDAPLAAALVEVDGGGIAVEHRVRGEHGADETACTTFAATTWHLASGSTARDAREIVVLFNPFPSPATVDAIFTTPDGRREPVRLQGLPVPAGSLIGVDLGTEVTRSEHVSGTFQARTGRVVVERLQQFDGSLGVEGLSISPGIPAPADTWVFADGEASAPAPTTPAAEDVGSTVGDADDSTDDEASEDAGSDDEGSDDEDEAPVSTSERIVVYNPGDERAEVKVEAVPTTEEPGPGVPPFSLSIRPGGYEIVDYGQHERIAAGVPHATVVRTTAAEPVVVERATVDVADESSGGEISTSAGSRVAASRWLFPSVAGLGGEGPVTFAVLNPVGDRPLRAVVSPIGGAADPIAAVAVPAGGRAAIEVDGATAAGMKAALVEADGPVVVERVTRGAGGQRLAMGAGIPLALDAVLVGSAPGGGLSASAYP